MNSARKESVIAQSSSYTVFLVALLTVLESVPLAVVSLVPWVATAFLSASTTDYGHLIKEGAAAPSARPSSSTATIHTMKRSSTASLPDRRRRRSAPPLSASSGRAIHRASHSYPRLITPVLDHRTGWFTPQSKISAEQPSRVRTGPPPLPSVSSTSATHSRTTAATESSQMLTARSASLSSKTEKAENTSVYKRIQTMLMVGVAYTSIVAGECSFKSRGKLIIDDYYAALKKPSPLNMTVYLLILIPVPLISIMVFWFFVYHFYLSGKCVIVTAVADLNSE
ncbi:hypothetical protein V5799_019784 [Amblyomma americanum]|uniref:Uncharacterized protein n=1 Tax=Amblyomma americanum TaxID=6943 RepID=A0AAQ4EVI3_AMBAM